MILPSEKPPKARTGPGPAHRTAKGAEASSTTVCCLPGLPQPLPTGPTLGGQKAGGRGWWNQVVKGPQTPLEALREATLDGCLGDLCIYIRSQGAQHVWRILEAASHCARAAPLALNEDSEQCINSSGIHWRGRQGIHSFSH